MFVLLCFTRPWPKEAKREVEMWQRNLVVLCSSYLEHLIKNFFSHYSSGVLIYDRRVFVRLATSVWLVKTIDKKCCGGGQVVSILVFYSYDPSLYPTEAYSFFCKMLLDIKRETRINSFAETTRNAISKVRKMRF